MSPDIDRDALERKATDARTRLATSLSALDRRGHDVVDMEIQVRRHAIPVVGAAAGLALVAGIGIAGLVRWSNHRSTERSAARFGARMDAGMDAVGRAWRHPERIAVHPPERSVLGRIGRNVLVSLATFAVSSLLRYAVRQVGAVSVPPRSRPQPRSAVATSPIVVRHDV